VTRPCPPAAALCLCALLASAASAQSITGGLHSSRDSDGLRETVSRVGYSGAGGLGLEAGGLHYNAPGWRESGALLAATYRRHDAALELDARLGAARIGRHTHAIGAADALWTLARGQAVGLSFERDIVASVGGIEQGIVSNSLAVVADHAFGERFNVGLAAGTTRFSDTNRRDLLRTRWNLELAPDWGLNAYLKTRSYRNSDPYRPEYFSPRRLGEVSAGLSSRFALSSHAVLGIGADAGSQHTESGTQRIWSYALRLSAPRNAALQWSLAVEASTAGGVAQTSATGSYRYARATAQISTPF
jgi:hypothetical protein